MATVAGLSWSRQAISSPDAASPVYPERPIRPLPKRRLRSRLSEEQAESIVYPPVPPSSSPLFGSPQSQSDRSFVNPHYSGDVNVLTDEHDHDHVCDCGEHHSGLDSDEEEEERASMDRGYWANRMLKYPRDAKDRVANQFKPPPPNSSTSSADGYESFENTNNKKKRKIPVSGLGQPLSGDGSGGMGIPTQSVDVSSPEDRAIGQYYGSGTAAHSSASGIGLSGPGRGRYSRSNARPLADRRPLMNSTNSMNAFANGMNDKGIISAAMANATETGQTPPPKGQENISLLQRHKQTNPVPQNFTFEYKSASSDKMASARPQVPPSTLPKAPPAPRVNQNVAAQGTQTGQTDPIAATQQPAGVQGGQAAQQPPPKPSKPRRPGHAYRMAALRRKEQQRIENYYNEGKPNQERWICHFCEYEAIFGEEPHYLVRQYEIRDRRERKEREKNRKRLEQAKAKGRKGKKPKASSKNAHAAATAAANNQAQNQRYDPQYDGPQDGDSQGDEFFEDEYDDAIPGTSPIDHDADGYPKHEHSPAPGGSVGDHAHDPHVPPNIQSPTA